MPSVLATPAVDTYITAYHIPAMAAVQQIIADLSAAKAILTTANAQYAGVQTVVAANAISNFTRAVNGATLETGGQITSNIAQIQALLTAISTLGL